jgi:hypothetical protein
MGLTVGELVRIHSVPYLTLSELRIECVPLVYLPRRHNVTETWGDYGCHGYSCRSYGT